MTLETYRGHFSQSVVIFGTRPLKLNIHWQTMSQKAPSDLCNTQQRHKETYAVKHDQQQDIVERDEVRKKGLRGIRGVFGRARNEVGTKGSERGENEGRDGSSSHCIPTRHIPVHIWLQYTHLPLLTIPHSPSQTHKT